MSTPTIELNGKTYIAAKPKTAIWRKFVKFNNTFANKNIVQDKEVYFELIDLIASGFNNPEVNAESIENGLDLDEFMPKFIEINLWIGKLVSSKINQLPNEKNPVKN